MDNESISCRIHILPLEILIKIFQHLDITDLLSLSEVNWNFYDAINQSYFLDRIAFKVSETINASQLLLQTKRVYRHLSFHVDNLTFSSSPFKKSLWNVIGPGVRSLRLKNCHVCDKDITEIFRACPQLEYLDLGRCDNIFMSGCFLNSAMCNDPLLPSLKHLNIQENRYMSDALITKIFTHAPNLSGLDVSNCNISFNDRVYQRYYPSNAGHDVASPSESVLMFQTMLKFISNNASEFQFLNFSGTMIDRQSLKKLFSIDKLNLTELILFRCNQVSSDLSSTIRLMSSLKILRLDVRSPFLHHESCLSAIGSSLPDLETLDLIWNEHLRSGYLLPIAKLSGLKYVDFLGPCTHIVEDLKQIFCLESREGLIEISMESGNVPGALICEIVHFVPNLRKLSLSRNDLTNESVKCILAGLPKLEFLDLSFNDIDDDAFVFENRPQDFRLIHLNLAKTRVTDETLLTFFSLLPNLKHVDLSECEITDHGLLSMSRSCCRIQKLVLVRCSKLTDVGLEGSLKYLANLRVVAVQGCYLLTDRMIDLIKKFE